MDELMKVSIFAPFILLGANVHLTRMSGEISNQNIDNEYFISIHLMTYKYDCKKHGGRRLGWAMMSLCIVAATGLQPAWAAEFDPTTGHMTATQQKGIITGRIVDETGEPVVGANIVVKGTTTGTTTDLEGRFSLTVEGPNVTLVVSYVGYEQMELPAVAGSTLNLRLVPDCKMLDDLVVIGYGSKDKKSLTSSISSLKNDDIERLARSASTVDGMLGGAVKGVFSVQSSGAPGAGPLINVRGITSPIPRDKMTKQSNAPLYVIDGMPYFVEDNNLNPLLAISPYDIESVDILKDASATAIYGSRGANGVVIVKTRNGRKNEKMTIDAGYTLSVGNPIKEYSPLNPTEFRQLQGEIMDGTVRHIRENLGGMMDANMYTVLQSFGKVEATLDEDTYLYKLTAYNGLRDDVFGRANTNWNDEITHRNATTQQYYVSLRGGSAVTNYSVSLNAMDQEGLMKNDRLKHYGGRMAIDTEVSKWVKAGATLSYSGSARHSGNLREGFQEGLTAWRMRPDLPVRDEQGNFMRFDATPLYGVPIMSPNPVAVRDRKNRAVSSQFMGNGYADVTILEGLKAHAEVNVSVFGQRDRTFIPSHAQSLIPGVELKAELGEEYSTTTQTSANVRLDYNRSFGHHNLAALLGVGADRTHYQLRTLSASDFFNESDMDNIGSANTYLPIMDAYARGGLNSTYARVSYDYAQRYLTELSLRSDASSKFGPNNRTAVFPAVSLGWRLGNEQFMAGACSWLDDLKLRLSWGKTGSTNVDDFSYLRYYSKGGRYGEKPGVWLERNLPNRDIRWEITTEYNGGIDFSLFDHRLYGSIDLYNRTTKGALVNSPYLAESGMNSYTSNLIDMSNRGFELELGGDIVRTADFTWSTSFNIASNRNKVLKLNGANLNSQMQDLIVEGEPVGVIKGFRTKGIAKDQAEIDRLNAQAAAKGYGTYQTSLGVGDYILEDVNGDGRITSDDRTVIGSPLPKFFGGWNHTLTYRNVDLSLFMQFSQGGKAFYSDVGLDLESTLGQSITRETFGRTWTPERREALFPRLVYGQYSSYNAKTNDRMIYSTSYLRMKNITLTYRLPKAALRLVGVQSASVFAMVTNLFTLTAWPGLDPELVGSGIHRGQGNDADPYPLSRTVSFGVHLQF